jgi:hypothetical protein
VEENLLGHLLKANDPVTTREVEQLLATDPVAIHDLAVLRKALAPLQADRDEMVPPADLWARTLARVAEHMVASEGPITRPEDSRTAELIRRAAAVTEPTVVAPPVAPVFLKSEGGLPPARRRNVIAVIGLSAAALALALPAVLHVRARSHQLACQDTMRQFYQAASKYSEHHDGRFPQVGDGEIAASAADALKVAGCLPLDVRFTCPSARPDETSPMALANYAYSLGFRDVTGELHGTERTPGSDLMPILADAPHRQASLAVPVNHRHGQNVLFAGGNVRFCNTPNVGWEGDDIFCNVKGQVGAGLHKFDTALGRPEERP